MRGECVGLLDGPAIGQRVRVWREARKWSQRQLAEKAGVSNTSISHLEAGRVPYPSYGQLQKLALVFGVSVSDLTGEGEEVSTGSGPYRIEHFPDGRIELYDPDNPSGGPVAEFGYHPHLDRLLREDREQYDLARRLLDLRGDASVEELEDFVAMFVDATPEERQDIMEMMRLLLRRKARG